LKTIDPAKTSVFDQAHGARLPGLEPYRRPGRNIEPISAAAHALESQARIGLKKMIVGPDLDGSIAAVLHGEDNGVPVRVYFNITESGHEFTWNHRHISMNLDVELSSHSLFFGWDIYSFGRRASGESWRRGKLRANTRIRRAERILWSEAARVDAPSGFSESAVGLSGFAVCGTFVVAGRGIAADLLARCREVNRAYC
jgi:UreD urease accessory protein